MFVSAGLKIMTKIFFGSIIMLRFGKTKENKKKKCMVRKNLKKFETLY